MNTPTRTGVIKKYINNLIDDIASGKKLPFDDRDHLAQNIATVMDIPVAEAEAYISPEADLFLAKADGTNSPKSYSIFAGTITDKYGAVIGLPFPIDVGYKTINGPEAWKQYQKDMANEMADKALLISYIKNDMPYHTVREIVEA